MFNINKTLTISLAEKLNYPFTFVRRVLLIKILCQFTTGTNPSSIDYSIDMYHLTGNVTFINAGFI